MKLSSILKLSVNMLIHSKLRSWLTIIGIFIGIAAVVAIISIGQGLQQSINSQLQGLGQDMITITSGGSRVGFGAPSGFGESSMVDVKELSEKDIEALKLVPGIAFIDGVIGGRASVRYQGSTAQLSVQGNDPSVFNEFVTVDLEAGRYITSGDVRSVVIGHGIAYNVFDTKINIGSVVTISNKSFRVTGILESGSGFISSDNNIYMSTKDARDVLNSTITLKQDEFSSIIVKVSDPDFVNETSTSIENALMNSHHVTKAKEDFTVTSALAIQERFSTITGTMVLFLGSIAAVSLLVGGVGVANTMFTSVLEKTREIGIMKAIGARNSDILLIFLINSGLLGLVGGVLGIIFGVLVSLILPILGLGSGSGPAGFTFTPSISLELLVFGVLFSIAIGMISGAVPAYNASKLRPVEALRYE